MAIDIYKLKQRWKISLFFIAIAIGISSTWYTNYLVKKISNEERRKIELWAEATKELEEVDLSGTISLTVYKMIQENNTIPVILLDENSRIITALNLDTAKSDNDEYLHSELEIMKAQHPPIEINYIEGKKNYIYYKDSTLLTMLFYYPYIQLAVITLFILVSYLAVRSSSRAEENQLWVGMSKETAHQLGTPLSSLLAFVEMMKNEEGSKIITEVEKDVKRLETITQRFSKIGSQSELTPVNLSETLTNAISYLKSRTSSKVNYTLNLAQEVILVPMNSALFEWVIENLCKNAVDAMDGVGEIEITVSNQPKEVSIDIRDTGKGISKSKFKTVFKAGYTTKKRGWGLGLSLAKRIIEYYHKGKIFVKQSDLNKGTTFRIILKK